MRRLVTLSVALSTLAFAGAASAQSQAEGQNRTLSYQQRTGGAVGRLTAAEQAWRFESEEQRRARLGSPEQLEDQYGAERMDLARRVADLIERGECRQARELATQAGERSMVIRIRQTCRQRS